MSDFTDAPDIAAPDPLFDLALVALAVEDFSAIYLMLQSWRATGVSDIEAYLTQRPEGINEYFSHIKVLKVNQRMLDLYGAKDVQALLAAGDALFDNSDRSTAIAEIARLWNGATSYQFETINYTVDRQPLNIRLCEPAGRRRQALGSHDDGNGGFHRAKAR